MYPISPPCVRTPAAGSLPGALERHYLDMLRPFARLEVTELTEGKGDPARQLREEAEAPSSKR